MYGLFGKKCIILKSEVDLKTSVGEEMNQKAYKTVKKRLPAYEYEKISTVFLEAII